MAIVAGIDEAGYGPMLGPLVASAAAFRVPEEKTTCDLWELFQIGHATDRRKTWAGVKVADSKALHTGTHGLRVLEENTLPFLRILSATVNGFPGLLHEIGANNKHELRHSPWYRGQDLKLPLQANPQRVLDRTTQLARALDAAHSAFCGARIELLTAAEFNADVAETNNKSATLWKRIGALIKYLWDDFGAEGARLIVDKQGGRNKYGVFLRALFPDADITVNTESALVSGYWIEDPQHALSIVFQPKADRYSLPTALASMFSKYTRELCMSLFNAYWRKRLPDLEPTAGYVVDARRFLKDIAAAMKAEGTAPNIMIRTK